MILRPAGSSPAFAYPPASRSRSKLSPQAMTAITMSLVFHACVGAYLFAYHFTMMTLPTPPSDPPVVIATVTFPPSPPPRPAPTREKQQSPRQKAQEPIRVHEAPRLVGLDPGPTIEAPSGPTAAGGGPSLTQVVPTPVIPPVPPKPKVILNPDWIHQPSGAQLAGAYPGRALDLGVAGSVTLLCAVGVDGQVRDCKVAEETPRDYGFGPAALKLSRWFKIRPETENGQAVDGALVRVPLKFGVG